MATPATGPRLELRQSQSLVMTAQLQQSIKLLQLSSLELSEFIASEIEQNPFLTRDDGNTPENAESPANDDIPVEQEVRERAAKGREEDDVVQFGEQHAGAWDEGANSMLDAPREAFWDDAEGGTFTPNNNLRNPGQMSADAFDGMESQHSEGITLQAHLREQLQVDIVNPVQRLVGLHLIDLVDERGYLPEDLSSVEETLGCSAEEIEAVLKLLQRFDPIGVFARNLKECLTIQLKEKDRFDPTMEKMVEHLDVLAAGDVKKLARLCGVEQEDIPFMLKEIQELNPKPGYRFSTEVMQAVVPDVFLRRTADRGWQVELNSDALPRVLINRQYYSRISESARRKEDKKYLSEQLAHASWLTKALDQRAQTILKVATEIVRQQDAFFRHGVRYFKALTLKDISQKIDVHESTVSRVTTQKYISTGSAVYELKYFFSSSVGSTDGDGEIHSSQSVKYLIKDMIDKEDPKAILSDDTIAEKLHDQGIDIARRTVAKYREAMDIPSSPARRLEKKRKIS